MGKKIDGDWTITDNSGALQAMTPVALLRATTKLGIKWQEIATDIVTDKGIVDTGELRKTLSYNATENAVQVGSPLKYAIYNELGTSRMPARPFIVPAIKDNGEIYQRIVADEFKLINL